MPRHRMRWLTHTIVDVALGAALLIAGIHGHGTDFLVIDATGSYLLVVTALTDAGGGLWRVVPRLVHRILDGLVGAALLLSPLLVWRSGSHLDVFATVIAEAVGVIVLRDAVVTDHRKLARPITAGMAGAGGAGAGGRRPGAGGTGGRGSAPIDVVAHESMTDTARKAGQAAGQAAARARRIKVALRQASGASARSARSPGSAGRQP